MEAVLMEEHHTHGVTQMREMSTGEIGRIIGRPMVIHVHAGRRNILCLRIYMQIAFFRSRLVGIGLKMDVLVKLADFSLRNVQFLWRVKGKIRLEKDAGP
ncbi:hypothetical protein D5086_028983 [Populus alba]|uniref:Uncharacterized protein n=1 Tax=Populus alba TaxID=43335 RepID=A0ACC4AS96_POPAL